MMEEVLVRVEGTAGRLTLNRPRALNALTPGMVATIAQALDGWEADRRVRFVLLDGAGERGLCAGGDIKALYEAVTAGVHGWEHVFFRTEYRLNARIARYGKPYVALMDGLVMGGGIGVSAHGSWRIVTERSRLAMPETSIGLFPDVGGTFLLSRAPGELGTHLAMTAGQIGAADAILCGLADAYVPSAQLPALVAALHESAGAADVQACLSHFAEEPPPGQLAGVRAWIDACYAHDEAETILAALSAHADPAAREAAEAMAGKSPAALKLTLRALRGGRGTGRLEPCLEREYRMALACVVRHDFREGVRAAVIDKDRRPAWSPATLAEVSPELVEALFTAPDHGGLGLAS
jgi:enoyl-CoA hydratase